MNHPIEGLMKTTMDSLKEMIDVNTIVGDAVETKDGNIIIPISKVCIGFASGGSEFCKDSKSAESKDAFPFGGGSGAGITIHPVAFLVVKNDSVKLLPVNVSNSMERVVDGIPGLINDVINMFKKDKNNVDKESYEEEPNENIESDSSSKN